VNPFLHRLSSLYQPAPQHSTACLFVVLIIGWRALCRDGPQTQHAAADTGEAAPARLCCLSAPLCKRRIWYVSCAALSQTVESGSVHGHETLVNGRAATPLSAARCRLSGRGGRGGGHVSADSVAPAGACTRQLLEAQPGRRAAAAACSRARRACRAAHCRGAGAQPRQRSGAAAARGRRVCGGAVSADAACGASRGSRASAGRGAAAGVCRGGTIRGHAQAARRGCEQRRAGARAQQRAAQRGGGAGAGSTGKAGLARPRDTAAHPHRAEGALGGGSKQ